MKKTLQQIDEVVAYILREHGVDLLLALAVSVFLGKIGGAFFLLGTFTRRALAPHSH